MRPDVTGSHADDTAWRTIASRDRSADGTFVYAVRSTGVYCRPSCSSRAARRDRIRIFANPIAARAGGYRACLRCAPDDERAGERARALVAHACRIMTLADRVPAIETLAAEAGLDRHRLGRLVRDELGLAPAALARHVRAERAAKALDAGTTVLHAALEAGYPSVARFYADARFALGMQVAAYRAGGGGERIAFALATASPATVVLAARTRAGICAVATSPSTERLESDLRLRFPGALALDRDPELATALGRALDVARSVVDAELDADVIASAYRAHVRINVNAGD